MVKINSSTVLSIGGYNGSNVAQNTYFYNIQTNKWRPGPPLQTPRHGLSCGTLKWKNPETDQWGKLVLVAGGGNNGHLQSVEFLFLNDDDIDEGDWVYGPSLPDTTFAPTLIEYYNSVILIGGSRKDAEDGDFSLYQLLAPNKSWVKMEKTLKMKRSWHISFLVPDDLAEHDLCYLDKEIRC